MKNKTDPQPEINYSEPLPIVTGDLMKSRNRLDNLLRRPGTKGLLALSQITSPIYITMPKNASRENRIHAIRIVFALAAIGKLFSHVQVIDNEDALPDHHVTVEANAGTEKCIHNHMLNTPPKSPTMEDTLFYTYA